MPVDVPALHEARARYDAWLDARPDVSEAMCWTVAIASGAEVPDAMDCFSPDWQQSARVTFDELVDTSFDDKGQDPARAHVAWAITTKTHIGLLEVNGFGGSTSESIRAWSHRYGRVAGMFWNVNSINKLSIGHRDQVESVEMFGGGDDLAEAGRLVRAYSPILTGDVSWGAGLAVVEAETGFRLDADILNDAWPMVRFAARQLSPRRPPMKIAHDDAVLAMALMNAGPDRLISAMTLTARAVIDAAALADDPGAVLAMGAIAHGELLPPTPSGTLNEFHELLGRLWAAMEASPHRAGDVSDPAFQRYQAAATLENFTNPRKRDDGWLHARFALAERWQPVREQLLELLS